MRSFEEIIKDCINNRENKQLLGKYCFELFELQEIKELGKEVKILNKKIPSIKKLYYFNQIDIANIDILSYIFETIKIWNFKQNPPKMLTFKNAVVEVIAKQLYNNLTQEEKQLIKANKYKKDNSKIIPQVISADKVAYNDSKTTILDEIQSDDNTESRAVNIEYLLNKNSFKNELLNIGLKVNTRPFIIMLAIYDITVDNHFDKLHDLVIALNFKQNIRDEIKELLIHCAKKSKRVRKMFSSFFSFTIYEKFIEYLLSCNNKKLKIPELIIDFNKIRNYLSVLLLNDNLIDKAAFVEKCSFGSISSYEKEIHRILSLFKTDKTIFDFKHELKYFSPNNFSKIFEIHTASNLISNFLILNVLQQYKLQTNCEEIKLAKIIEILFPENSQNIIENDKNNFRKYTILPRLKEMKEYGFININQKHKDRYILNTKFLNDKYKNILKYVVPFFCGVYPFSSIGHFLENRLESKDIFKFKSYNVNNILDDCITYDLLKAINNKERIKIVFQDKKRNVDKLFKPVALFIENETKLLKVRSDKEEYYLHEINDIKYDKKSKNPIFSEIYSFYYKIFEELVKEYKKNPKFDKSKVLKKYGTKDTIIIFEKIDKNILPLLAKLDNIEIPLTALELRWLKTIMQDVRFDLFVTSSEKQYLEDLVKDVEPFDLSAFKIYNSKAKKYECVTDFGIPKGINKNLFREELEKTNTIWFSVDGNFFSEVI